MRALFLGSALAFLACACGPTSAQKAESDLAAVRTETTAATLVERGKAFAAVGDPTRAEEYLASAIDAGADPREVLPLLFDVCIKTGRYRSAIQHGENQLRKRPDDDKTRVMVGALYVAIGEAEEARKHLERIVSDDGGDGGVSAARAKLLGEAHYYLAVLARDVSNDVVGADRHFREYLRLEPNGAHDGEARASLLKRVPTEGGAP